VDGRDKPGHDESGQSAEGGLHILLAGDAAAIRVVQRLQFLDYCAVDAGAARLDVARHFGMLFLILLRP
jgi:hypothetical protein